MCSLTIGTPGNIKSSAFLTIAVLWRPTIKMVQVSRNGYYICFSSFLLDIPHSYFDNTVANLVLVAMNIGLVMYNMW